jgi:hypothetical protein
MSVPRTVLLAIGIPVVISSLVGIGIHAYLAASAPPLPQTVAEAVTQRAGIRLVELIKKGADPKLPVDVSLTEVAGGRPIPLTPLMIAIARDERDFLRLLLSLGIPWSDEERADAYCLAIVLNSTHWPLLGAPTVERSTCPTRMERLSGVGYQTFTASGTFTVPMGSDTVTASVWGGGGGGGALRQMDVKRGGGGGGGGALGKKTVTGLSGGATIAVTVAAGGAGGASSNDGLGNPGEAGGDSSFGAYVTAGGGAGGAAGSAANAAGGTCTGADVCHVGGRGGMGAVDAGDYANGGGGGGGGGQGGKGGDGGHATNNGQAGQPAGGAAGTAGANGGGAGGRGSYGGSAGSVPGGGGGGGCSGSGACPPGMAGARGHVIVQWRYRRAS